MSFSNDTETELLTYIFDTTAPAWAGNANFWVALHTADPGEAGTAVTSEAAYGSYARVSVSRTTGFTITGNQVSNAAQVQFPQSTSAGSGVTHWSVVTTSSGAGQIIMRGALSSAVPTSIGIQPQFSAGALSATLN